MNLTLDEYWEVLYALEDKVYHLEENPDSDKEHITYLKTIIKKYENKIKNWEA